MRLFISYTEEAGGFFQPPDVPEEPNTWEHLCLIDGRHYAVHRVGVASTSHEAIRNVLMGCLAALDEGDADIDRQRLNLAHKVSGDDDGYPDGFIGVTRATANDDPAFSSASVVGGTAFFFSRPEFAQTFDWLFIDEAGQVSLANLLAMGRAARNIVLVGDPRQLPQVIQGAHPHPANLSCLEWLLGDHATIPPDRGIFLPISRRMHPEVCRFISDQVYEGRLTSHPDTARQRVGNTSLTEAGAFWVPIAHEGNSQISPEEVSAIRATIDELMRGTWTEKREARKREARLVAFNGRKLDPTDVDLLALSDELQQALSPNVLSKALGSSADLAQVKRGERSPERSSGRKGSKNGRRPRVPEEKTELIGRLGELIVYHWLRRILPSQDIDSAWLSENGTVITGREGNDGLGYDFEVSYRNQIWQIEVKASGDDPQSFEVGETEVRAARLAARPRSGVQYKIAYVSHVAEPTKTQIEMLPNPMTEEGARFLELRGEGIRYGFKRNQ